MDQFDWLLEPSKFSRGRKEVQELIDDLGWLYCSNSDQRTARETTQGSNGSNVTDQVQKETAKKETRQESSLCEEEKKKDSACRNVADVNSNEPKNYSSKRDSSSTKKPQENEKEVIGSALGMCEEAHKDQPISSKQTSEKKTCSKAKASGKPMLRCVRFEDDRRIKLNIRRCEPPSKPSASSNEGACDVAVDLSGKPNKTATIIRIPSVVVSGRITSTSGSSSSLHLLDGNKQKGQKNVLKPATVTANKIVSHSIEPKPLNLKSNQNSGPIILKTQPTSKKTPQKEANRTHKSTESSKSDLKLPLLPKEKDSSIVDSNVEKRLCTVTHRLPHGISIRVVAQQRDLGKTESNLIHCSISEGKITGSKDNEVDKTTHLLPSKKKLTSETSVLTLNECGGESSDPQNKTFSNFSDKIPSIRLSKLKVTGITSQGAANVDKPQEATQNSDAKSSHSSVKDAAEISKNTSDKSDVSSWGNDKTTGIINEKLPQCSKNASANSAQPCKESLKGTDDKDPKESVEHEPKEDSMPKTSTATQKESEVKNTAKADVSTEIPQQSGSKMDSHPVISSGLISEKAHELNSAGSMLANTGNDLSPELSTCLQREKTLMPVDLVDETLNLTSDKNEESQKSAAALSVVNNVEQAEGETRGEMSNESENEEDSFGKLWLEPNEDSEDSEGDDDKRSTKSQVSQKLNAGESSVTENNKLEGEVSEDNQLNRSKKQAETLGFDVEATNDISTQKGNDSPVTDDRLLESDKCVQNPRSTDQSTKSPDGISCGLSANANETSVNHESTSDPNKNSSQKNSDHTQSLGQCKEMTQEGFEKVHSEVPLEEGVIWHSDKENELTDFARTTSEQLETEKYEYLAALEEVPQSSTTASEVRDKAFKPQKYGEFGNAVAGDKSDNAAVFHEESNENQHLNNAENLSCAEVEIRDSLESGQTVDDDGFSNPEVLKDPDYLQKYLKGSLEKDTLSALDDAKSSDSTQSGKSIPKQYDTQVQSFVEVQLDKCDLASTSYESRWRIENYCKGINAQSISSITNDGSEASDLSNSSRPSNDDESDFDSDHEDHSYCNLNSGGDNEKGSSSSEQGNDAKASLMGGWRQEWMNNIKEKLRNKLHVNFSRLMSPFGAKPTTSLTESASCNANKTLVNVASSSEVANKEIEKLPAEENIWKSKIKNAWKDKINLSDDDISHLLLTDDEDDANKTTGVQDADTEISDNRTLQNRITYDITTDHSETLHGNVFSGLEKKENETDGEDCNAVHDVVSDMITQVVRNEKAQLNAKFIRQKRKKSKHYKKRRHHHVKKVPLNVIENTFSREAYSGGDISQFKKTNIRKRKAMFAIDEASQRKRPKHDSKAESLTARDEQGLNLDRTIIVKGESARYKYQKRLTDYFKPQTDSSENSEDSRNSCFAKETKTTDDINSSITGDLDILQSRPCASEKKEIGGDIHDVLSDVITEVVVVVDSKEPASNEEYGLGPNKALTKRKLKRMKRAIGRSKKLIPNKTLIKSEQNTEIETNCKGIPLTKVLKRHVKKKTLLRKKIKSQHGSDKESIMSGASDETPRGEREKTMLSRSQQESSFSMAESYDDANVYKCKLCEYVSKRKDHYKLHVWKHSRMKFVCPACPYSTNNESVFNLHKANHRSSLHKDMPAPSTNKEHTVKSETKVHSKRRGHPRSVSCGICGKKFGSKKQLPLHQLHHKTVVSKKRRTGEPAEKSSDVDSLNEVPEIKVENSCFRCTYCSETFLNEISLLSHEKLCVSGTQASTNAENSSTSKDPEKDATTPRTKQPPRFTFKCSYCSYFCNDFAAFKLHKESHSKTESYSCEYCGKKFVRKTMLAIHLRLHGRVGLLGYSCKICGKEFESANSVRSHANRIHSGQRESYKCKFCEKEFVRKTMLDIHLRFHGLRYSCKICGKQFDTPLSVRSHANRAHSERRMSYSCEYCGKKFVRKIKLNIHLRLHKGKGSGKRLNAARDVQTNEDKAPGTNKFHYCNYCDKKFYHKNRLYIHLRLHSLRYSCKICGKQFDTPISVRSHENKVHGRRGGHANKVQRKSFSCEYCGKNFGVKGVLDIHRRVHGVRYSCKVCGKQFKAPRGVQTHAYRVHGHEISSRVSRFCAVCEKTFSSPVRLQNHIRIKHGSVIETRESSEC